MSKRLGSFVTLKDIVDDVGSDAEGCFKKRLGIDLLCHQCALKDTITTAIYTVTMDL